MDSGMTLVGNWVSSLRAKSKTESVTSNTAFALIVKIRSLITCNSE
jgi:hypothetical protein